MQVTPQLMTRHTPTPVSAGRLAAAERVRRDDDLMASSARGSSTVLPSLQESLAGVAPS
ncbi:hypothetical protein KEM52_005862 [Ascosphaera acerosa]|nr:hypothetical protein KEM52_005862 [Ascosphaera acerosa]